jgi:hypothetical protein
MVEARLDELRANGCWFAPGYIRNRLFGCSHPESFHCVAAAAGIEPAPAGYRRNPFTRHRRGYKFISSVCKSPGIIQPGLASDGPVSSVRFGDSSSPRRGRLKEVSRAFATGDFYAPGKNRARALPPRLKDEAAGGFEPPYLYRVAEKYPRTAPLEQLSLPARGNDRDAVSFHVKRSNRILHHSWPGRKIDLDDGWIQQRNQRVTCRRWRKEEPIR